MSPIARRAVMPLIAIILTALNLRTAVTGFTPLLQMIGDELGFGPSLYGLLGTLVAACFGIFGFLSAIVARRIGLDAAIAGAVVLTTAGIVLRAVSTDAAALAASTVVALIGVGSSNVLVVPLVKKYFGDHLKAVSSLYLALMQVGQFVAPLIAVPVALAVGWRWSVGVWALLTGAAALLWIVIAVRARRTAVAASVPPIAERLTGAWRTPLLWAMVLLLGMTALNVYAIVTWLPTILVDAGADPASGGALLALFSVFGLLAAFVVPPLTIRLRNPFAIVVVCTALMAAGYAGLLLAPGEGAIAWVVLLGLGVSTFPMCMTLVNVRTRTTGGATLLSGAMQGIGYGIACVGPLGIGLLYEATGGWAVSYAVLFASLAVMLVAGAIACRPVLLEDQAARGRELVAVE